MSEASRTLVLNSTYEPLKVISWERAITLLFLGKVELVRTYDRQIRSVSLRFHMPAVVRLLRFVRRKRPEISFSRKNLFARDEHQCQYCGTRREHPELTYDHVLPRSQGGRTEWTNIVTCCVPCNRKKGGRTPEQAAMKLRRVPKRPDHLPGIVTVTIGINHAPDSWRDFLVWHARVGRG